MSAPAPLVARDLFKRFGDRPVLTGIDVVANPGQPLGIVGENGSGKTTLLRLLVGLDSADAGTISRPADLGHLAQEPGFAGGQTVGGVLADALAPLREHVRQLEDLAHHLDDPDQATAYAEALAWAEMHGAWDAEYRAETAVSRLGLSAVDLSQPVASLSGGERSRLALAALVTRRPQGLILDEPTNHLDDAALEFVEDFLVSLPGVVVVASHDRVLLDRVCGAVLDLDESFFGVDGEGGRRYSGGYTSYLAEKARARTRWETAFTEQQDELSTLRTTARTTARQVAHNRPARDNDKFIYKFKGANVQSTISRRVRDAEQRIDNLLLHQVPKPPAPLRFTQPLARSTTATRVWLRDVGVHGRLDLARLDVGGDDHLLVTGANGSGKSTLLSLIAGQVYPDSGVVEVSAERIALLPQDVTFSRPDQTPQELFDRLTGSPRPLGSLGLLHPRDLNRPIGDLSVGQQRRLALAVLVARQPNLMLLDEPTNHISLALASELEDALRTTHGTVVIASHDRWLRRRWDGPVVAL